MNQRDAITYADLAAGVIASSTQASVSFASLLKIDRTGMALFLNQNPEVDAEALYLSAMKLKGTRKIKPWTEVAPRTRCAFEVYRATYRVLMDVVRADELAAREAERGKLSGPRVGRLAERTFDDRTDGRFDRVKLR